MNKPITVTYEDLKLALANDINQSELPAFIIEFALQDLLNEVRVIANRQYQLDKARYEEDLVKERCEAYLEKENKEDTEDIEN